MRLRNPPKYCSNWCRLAPPICLATFSACTGDSGHLGIQHSLVSEGERPPQKSRGLGPVDGEPNDLTPSPIQNSLIVCRIELVQQVIGVEALKMLLPRVAPIHPVTIFSVRA